MEEGPFLPRNIVEGLDEVLTNSYSACCIFGP